MSEGREALAWAAGIIDGEGCFNLRHRKYHAKRCGGVHVYPRACLDVGQESHHTGIPQMLRRLQQVLGGNVMGPHRRHLGSDFYTWYLHGFERVQAAIAMLWPWLGDVKRAQARGVLEQVNALTHTRPGPVKGGGCQCQVKA